MQAFAPSQSQIPPHGDSVNVQLSAEDFDKLQEIHELINLIIKDTPAMSQPNPRSYTAQAPPVVPYTYSFYQLPWGRLPLVTS